jgi:HPt (histidine-containing phosphotransfer) domain-containing protein
MDRKLYNLRRLEEIAQGDQGFIHDMVNIFVENVTAEIDNILSFKTEGNWKSIAESAHKLASNFAYLGANSLHDLAAGIEKSVIYENNLTGIAEKTEQLCHEGMTLVALVKKDFYITSDN